MSAPAPNPTHSGGGRRGKGAAPRVPGLAAADKVTAVIGLLPCRPYTDWEVSRQEGQVLGTRCVKDTQVPSGFGSESREEAHTLLLAPSHGTCFSASMLTSDKQGLRSPPVLTRQKIP